MDQLKIEFGFFLLLLVAGTCAQRSPVRQEGPLAYVQARNAYKRARLFLKERLPVSSRDITDPETRKHFNYGILAGVTIALVKAFYSVTAVYEPLKVVQETVPAIWEDYDNVARTMNNYLDEVTAKTRPVTSLIDTLCNRTDSVEDCNLKVHQNAIHNSYVLYRAKFLLQIGKAARIINRQANLLDNVAENDNAVPYLFKLADSTPFEVFIAELTRVYEFIRPRKNFIRHY